MENERLNSVEVVRLGEKLYEDRIRAKIEPDNKGKFLVFDVETGDFEIDDDKLAALDKVKAKRPNAVLYILRIGYPAAVTLGAGTCGLLYDIHGLNAVE